MKRILIFVAVVCCVLLSGCADLKVREVQTIWNKDTKVAMGVVRNSGWGLARDFDVDFEGILTSGEPPIRVTQHVNVLGAISSVYLGADFGSLSPYDEKRVIYVHKMRVVADPRHTVQETNETNNDKEVSVP